MKQKVQTILTNVSLASLLCLNLLLLPQNIMAASRSRRAMSGNDGAVLAPGVYEETADGMRSEAVDRIGSGTENGANVSARRYRSNRQVDKKARRTRSISDIFTPDPVTPGIPREFGKSTVILYVRDQYNNLVDNCRLKISYDDGSGWCEITVMSNTPTVLKYRKPRESYQSAYCTVQKVMEVPEGYKVVDARTTVELIDGETVTGNLTLRSNKPRPTTAKPTTAPPPTTRPTTVPTTVRPTTTPTTPRPTPAPTTVITTLPLPSVTITTPTTVPVPAKVRINIDYVDSGGVSIKKLTLEHREGDSEDFVPGEALNEELKKTRGFTLVLAEKVNVRKLSAADDNKTFTIKVKKVYPATLIDSKTVKHKTHIKLVDENGNTVKVMELMLAADELIDIDLPEGYAFKNREELRRSGKELVLEIVRKEYPVEIVYVNSAGEQIAVSRQRVKHGDKVNLTLPSTSEGVYELRAGQEIPLIKTAKNLKYVLVLRKPAVAINSDTVKQTRNYRLIDAQGNVIATGRAERTGREAYAIKLPDGYELSDDAAWQAGLSENVRVRIKEYDVECIYISDDKRKIYADKQTVKHGAFPKVAIPEILQVYARTNNFSYEIDPLFKVPTITQAGTVLVPVLTVIDKHEQVTSGTDAEPAGDNKSEITNESTEKILATTPAVQSESTPTVLATETATTSIAAVTPPLRNATATSFNAEQVTPTTADSVTGAYKGAEAETAEPEKKPETETATGLQEQSQGDFLAKLADLLGKGKKDETADILESEPKSKLQVPATLTSSAKKVRPVNSSLFTLLNAESKQALKKLPLSVADNYGRIVRFTLRNGDYYYDVNGSESLLYTDDNGELLLQNLPDGDYNLLVNGSLLARLHIDNSLSDPGVESVLAVDPLLLQKSYEKLKAYLPDKSKDLSKMSNEELADLIRKAAADMNFTSLKDKVQLASLAKVTDSGKDGKKSVEYEVIKNEDGETIIRIKGDSSANDDVKAYKVGRTGEKKEWQVSSLGICVLVLILYMIKRGTENLENM